MTRIVCADAIFAKLEEDAAPNNQNEKQVDKEIQSPPKAHPRGVVYLPRRRMPVTNGVCKDKSRAYPPRPPSLSDMKGIELDHLCMDSMSLTSSVRVQLF